jgi:hypothetical protein
MGTLCNRDLRCEGGCVHGAFHQRKTLSFSCFFAAVHRGGNGSAKWGFRESEGVGQGDDWVCLLNFGLEGLQMSMALPVDGRVYPPCVRLPLKLEN